MHACGVMYSLVQLRNQVQRGNRASVNGTHVLVCVCVCVCVYVCACVCACVCMCVYVHFLCVCCSLGCIYVINSTGFMYARLVKLILISFIVSFWGKT